MRGNRASGRTLTTAGRCLALVLSGSVPLIAAAPAQAAGTTVALWHMDETSGSVMRDSSGHGNDGTLKNITLGLKGIQGRAYGFNGNNSTVIVPDDASLNPGSAKLTLTQHIKFDNPPAADSMDLIRKGEAGQQYYKMEILPSGQASCHWSGSKNPATVTNGPDLSDGRWHTVKCVKANSSVKLLVDGQTYSQSISIGSIANGAAMYLGSKSNVEDFYQGRMDEVSVKVG